MARASLTALYFRGLGEYTAGHLEAAERDFSEAVARKPTHAGALHHLGLVSQLSGRPRRALRLLRASVAADSRNAVYWLNLGNLFHQLGRTQDAVAAWEAAARIDETFEDAFRNIGLTCAESGEHVRAVAAFSRVTDLNPDSDEAFRRLARSLRRLGRSEEARRAGGRARALSKDPQALARFGAARLNADRPAECLNALRRAVRLAPRDAELRFQLANALAITGRQRQALGAYETALALDPRHGPARFRAAALRGEAPRLAPAGYVAGLFDTYASRYDEHLVGELRYRGPALLWRAVRRVLERQRPRAHQLTVLDAGCGTGLASNLLRGAAKRLVGVDLSRGMIEKARARAAYDRLIVGDLVRILSTTPERFDLIFCADVLNYFGDLAIPLRAVARALRPGGLAAFTVETGGGSAYAIASSGRFTHSPAYVRATSASCGLLISHMGTGTPRYERGMPVRATVAVLQKA